MSLRRTLAISRRIADLFRRDHRTLALLFIAPVIILALLGWVIRDQQLPPTRLGLVNLAGTQGELALDRVATATLEAGFSVQRGVDDPEAVRQGLADDRLDLALILVQLAPEPTMRVITPGVSPSDDNARVAELRTIFAEVFGRTGPVLELEAVFGPAEPDFLDVFAPALVGFLVFFLVFVLTGISFLRERMGGTLERLLATPVRRSEIVGGYSLGFGFFATLQVAVILAYALGSLTVPAIGSLESFSIGLGIANAGSPGLAFLVTLLLALAAVNLGIFLSTFARTELQVLQFIPVVIVPQGLLAGIFWPVDTLPDVLQPIARLMPMTYGIDGLRHVLVRGADLGSPALQSDVAVLAGMALALALLAAVTIRREVA